MRRRHLWRVWGCSDYVYNGHRYRYVYHEHRYKWTAWLCGMMQNVLHSFRRRA